MTRLSMVLAAAFCLLAGAAVAQEQEEGSHKGVFINNKGEEIGTVLLREEENGVLINLDVKTLSPGEHGFHIHDKGDCSPPETFANAGDHFNPGGTHAHGLAAAGGPHAGDMINLTADGAGEVKSEVLNSAVTMNPQETTRANILDADGFAIVIHAGADDYMTQPSGGSGDRVACAVIK